jgi:hypothetical protein
MNMTRIFSNMLNRYLPILTWGAEYSRQTLANDQNPPPNRDIPVS